MKRGALTDVIIESFCSIIHTISFMYMSVANLIIIHKSRWANVLVVLRTFIFNSANYFYNTLPGPERW
jgi:hypothetical protein